MAAIGTGVAILVLVVIGLLARPFDALPNPSGSESASAVPSPLDAIAWMEVGGTEPGTGDGPSYRLRFGTLDRPADAITLTVGQRAMNDVAIDTRTPAADGPDQWLAAYVADDGDVASVHLLDIRSGEDRVTHRLPQMVWTIVLDAKGGSIYAIVIDRQTFEDLGVWQLPLAGGEPHAVLPPARLAPADVPVVRPVAIHGFIGRLYQGDDGRWLIRDQCASLAADFVCERTALDLSNGEVVPLRETAGQPVYGVLDDWLLGERCGLKCDLEMVRIRDEQRQDLEIQSPALGIVAWQGHRIVLHPSQVDPRDGLAHALAVFDIDTGADRVLATSRFGIDLVPRMNVEAPDGWVTFQTLQRQSVVVNVVSMAGNSIAEVELPLLIFGALGTANS
ncbi:MAG TPA: hypothetical protein VFN76_09215 [Candidatus Limnocylindria bacterium]|nr:hypothetical protein [Candidatus Limnocylindria bacterium]